MKKILQYLIIFIIVFLPRLTGISSFSTVDEPDYIKYGGNFYYSLGQRDFDQAYQTYQPAVTTLYASALAYHLVFPAYKGLGQGYIDDTIEQTEFLEGKGVEPVRLLIVARIIMIILVSLFLTLAFLLLDLLIGFIPGLIIILLISFEPFFLGHSRLLTQEGLMSISVITSVLATIVYCIKKDRWIFVVISAITTAIAILTKLTAIVVLPVLAILFIFFWQPDPVHKKEHLIKRRMIAMVIWLVVFLAFTFAVWPALWNHPVDVITSLFEKSFGFLGSKEGVPVEELSLQGIITGNNIARYLSSLWWQIPPLTWVGSLIALFFFTIKIKQNSRTQNTLFCIFLVLAILMITMMSMGKKLANHYIMVTHVSLCILAGLGYIQGIDLVRGYLKDRSKNLATAILLLVIVVFQVLNYSGYSPYFFDYINPIALMTRGTTSVIDTGYGQGLEIAARYLSSKPGAEDLKVMSWWSTSLDYFFPGRTEQIWIIKSWRQEDVDELRSSDYLVVYYKTQLARMIPEGLMRPLEYVEPELNISIHDADVVRIYKVADLPPEVFVPLIFEP